MPKGGSLADISDQLLQLAVGCLLQPEVTVAGATSFLNFKLKEATRRLVHGVRRAAGAVEVGKGPVCPLGATLAALGYRWGLRPGSRPGVRRHAAAIFRKTPCFRWT